MWHSKLREELKDWVREYFTTKGDVERVKWRADEALAKVDALYEHLQVYYKVCPSKVMVAKKGGPECPQ